MEACFGPPQCTARLRRRTLPDSARRACYEQTPPHIYLLDGQLLTNILSASKDETLRDLLELSLQRFEHFVRLAEDGETSFKMVQEDFFDLALFESEMPDMTATEILKNLKLQLKTVELIMVLSSEFSQDTLQGMRRLRGPGLRRQALHPPGADSANRKNAKGGEPLLAPSSSPGEPPA